MKNLYFILAFTFLLTSCDVEHRKNIVVLIDNSVSIESETFDKYISTIQNSVVANLKDKDMLTVQFVDACSFNKSERIFRLDMSRVRFDIGNVGENNKDAVLKERVAEFIESSLIDSVAKVIRDKRTSRQGCGAFTDIINAVFESRKLFREKSNFDSKGELVLNEVIGEKSSEVSNYIILFSDMVNEDKAIKFDFTLYGNIDSDGILNQVDASLENKDIDLKGTKVIIYGATSNSENDKQLSNIQSFWEELFTRLGAKLIAYSYDTELEIDEE